MSGEEFVRQTVAAVEELTARVAVGVIRACVVARRLGTEDLIAAAAPGLCHTHLPTTRIVPGCVYCARAGNRFLPPSSPPPSPSQ